MKILLIVIGAVIMIGGSVGATLFLTGALTKHTEEALRRQAQRMAAGRAIPRRQRAASYLSTA